MIVAIDGPAGSGKSTIAGQLAARLGFEKLDTGAMYRAVALAALERAADLDDEDIIDELARTVRVEVARRAGERARVLLDGADVTDAIRTPAVDACVSKVSAYPGVRRAMLDVQRRAAEGHDIVAEGRDIGTVVFPAAEVKVFLTADPAERARRMPLHPPTRSSPRSFSVRSMPSSAATGSIRAARSLRSFRQTMPFTSIPLPPPSTRWCRVSQT